MQYDPKVAEFNKQADAEWFRVHRGRNFRIRPAVLGETRSPLPRGWRNFVAVHQSETGVMEGIAFATTAEPATTEDPAAMIYKHLRVMLGLGIREALPMPRAAQSVKGTDHA